ncbi:S-layer homology domain-containing protein [Sporobacter termitidis DSM 10068]|uniref:S-layer homology domain-containing protein n=1 Tax=Sporobacter termitidis DSM 10068 TaxID=1123282 RepID=A0A1M5YSN0_9FIRM|nr:immunoglobulin-like domain-containing protein [Sporobacter termitidis]SHI14949.1 S-layer homology domain-containing protein [Sporobacter termitidis DSM 10068]
MKKIGQRALSVVLAFLLLFSVLPSALAAAAPEENADSLIEFYKKAGLTHPLSALGIRSLTGDESVGGATFATPYDEKDSRASTFSAYTASGGSTGAADALAAIDMMAMGQNPRTFKMISMNTGSALPHDAIAALFDTLKEDGTFRYTTQADPANTLTGIGAGSTDLYAILALEMYYGGAYWAKDGDTGRQNRTAAIEAFLSKFTDSRAPNGTTWIIDGGRFFEPSNTYNISGMPPIAPRILVQSVCVALLSRWLDDDTIVTVGAGDPEPLKDVARREMDGLLFTLEKMFMGENITGTVSATNINNVKTRFSTYSEYLGMYISALVAAGQQDKIEELGLLDKLDACRIANGTYKQFSTQGDSYASASTARAAIALGDYIRGSAIMATLTFDADLSDMDTVLWDLDAISLPETASSNLTLPSKGQYGSAIAWTSSNEEAVNSDTGAVVSLSAGEQEITVKLTATAAYGGAAESKDFYVTVLPAVLGEQMIVNADIRALTIPLFVTGDFTLPDTGDNGSAISWSTSNSTIISDSGIVTKNESEQKVTLTADLTYGSEGAGTKTFEVTVGKIVAADDIVTQAVYQAREYYNTHRNLTGAYWEAWAAKAILRDDYDKYNFNTYNVRNHKKTLGWAGTDYGAVILQILAQGDNPYNYQGVNYVSAMMGYIYKNYEATGELNWGGYGEPIFLAMALDATGAMTPELFFGKDGNVQNSVGGKLCGQLNSFAYGIDLAGWAMVPIGTHYRENPAFFDQYLNRFKTSTISKIITDPDNDDYGLIVVNPDTAGYIYWVSNGCFLLGSVSLNNAGVMGFDLQNDSEWLQPDGTGIVDAIYNHVFKDAPPPYSTQPVITFGDLYYGENVWTGVGATKDKLAALLAEAEPKAESDGRAYTAKTFAELKAAYTAAAKFKDADYGYGEAYFTLRDALKNLKPAGSISVQVHGDAARETILDTVFVNSDGTYLQLLQQAARENSFSQTASGGAVTEIGGLKASGNGAWYCYDGQTLVVDLSGKPEEGAELTFKYCADTGTLPSGMALDDHLAYDAAQALVVGGAVDASGNVTGNISMPKAGLFGTTVTWYSDKLPTIDLDGNVTRNVSDDIKVKLTAKVSLNASEEYEKVFNVVVKATNPGSGTTPHTKTAYISIAGPIGGTTVSKLPFTSCPKTKIEIEPGETAYSLLVKTGRDIDANLNTQYGVYVKTIDVLGEFDEGPDSGWMFRVTHSGKTEFPGHSAALEPVSEGDYVEWLYTRDLGKDIGGYMGGRPDSPGSGSDTGRETINRVIESKPAVTGGKASATVDTATIRDTIDEIKKAVDKAKESDPNAAGELVLDIEPNGTASTVEVRLKAEAANAIANANILLTVKTGISTVTFDAAAIKAAVAGMTSTQEAIFTAGRLSKDSLTTGQKAVAGDNPVFEFTLKVGDKKVTDFGAGLVTVVLPYTPKADENTDNLKVYYLADDGAVTEMKGAKYNKTLGGFVFTANHFSVFFIGAKAVDLPFTDVKDTDWFYNAVRYAYENKLMNGTTADKFSPNDSMTRAMLVTALYRYAGEPAVTVQNLFSDVASGQWYTNAVLWANENGIVTGYGGLFGTNDNITREQIAAILMRYAEKKGLNVSKTVDLGAFGDASKISDWARDAMGWAFAEGLITGRTANTLVPDGNASRAEVVTILQRLSKTL